MVDLYAFIIGHIWKCTFKRLSHHSLTLHKEMKYLLYIFGLLTFQQKCTKNNFISFRRVGFVLNKYLYWDMTKILAF